MQETIDHAMRPGATVPVGSIEAHPLTVHIGFTADLDLPAFLAQAELKPISIAKVNFPPIWSLVTCAKD